MADRGGFNWANWAGNQRGAPARRASPASEEELARLILDSARVRAHGSGHSFTPLVPTDGTLLGLEGFAGVQEVDAAAKRAWIGAGTQLRAIGPALHEHGLALANMGDIDAQTLAGAISTGTHGTGAGLGALATQVTALRLVDGTGRAREIAAADPDFGGSVVALGALGVVTAYQIQCVPSYRLLDRRWNVHLLYLLENWDAASANTRHFEFFWFPYSDEALCKSLDPIEPGAPAGGGGGGNGAVGDGSATGTGSGAAGGIPGGGGMDDVPEFSAKRQAALAERERQAMELASWIARWVPLSSGAVQRWLTKQSLGHSSHRGHSWQIFPSPRDARFVEMEYCLPAAALEPVLREIAKAVRGGRIAGAYPVEVRRVQADELWLSPFHGRDSVTVAVHQHHRHDPRRLFDACEAIFREHQGRPHWGKMHTRSAVELADLYPRWSDFLALRAKADPDGRFLNPHLQDVFGV